MSRYLSTGRLAERCARRPWTTVILWLVITILAFYAVGRLLGGALTNEQQFTRAPESQKGQELVQERLSGPVKYTEIVVVTSEGSTVDDPAYQLQVERLAGGIRGLGQEQVESAVHYYETRDESMVSADRHSTIVPVVLSGTEDRAEETIDNLRAVTGQAAEESGMSILTTGMASVGVDSSKLAQADMQRMEIFGMGLALVILVVVFGTLVAAGLPILLAILSIITALGITAVVGQQYPMSFFVINMISMMGMAVGIDYTLFVVSRFREELARGRDKYEAITIAGNTAGKSVLFSGMTVILALAGMLMIPMSIFISLGAGAIFVVFASICASLTLLPAILSLLGHRVNSARIPGIHRFARGSEGGSRFWDTTTRTVMKRPLLFASLVVVVLAVPASYYLQMNTGESGTATLPDSLESKQAYLVLEKDFSLGLVAPVEIVVDGDLGAADVRSAISRLQASLESDPGVNGTLQVTENPAGDLAVISVPIAASSASSAAVETVERMRQELVPAAFAGSSASVYVSGGPAFSADYFNITDSYRLPVLAFVLGLSFVLLLIVFRSLVVPVKAILMNLLSVGAAYGFLVLVFQDGVGASWFGFHQVEAIDAWVPLFLFSVLFGLSMDYHVFLIGRIRERYLRPATTARL